MRGYRWRGCAIAERFRSDDAPNFTTTQGNTDMDTDTRTRIECTNWDEAGGPRSCVAVEFHAETKGGRTRRSASLPRGPSTGGPRSCAAVMATADATGRDPPATLGGPRSCAAAMGRATDAQERVPPYVGGSTSLRWGFDLPTLGVRPSYVGKRHFPPAGAGSG